MSDLLGKSPTKRAKPNYSYSIVSVALVLFLLGFFGLILLQTQRLIDIFKERVTVLIEIEPGADSLSVMTLKQDLEAMDYTKKESIRYISKDITFNVQSKFMESDLLSQIKKNFKTRAYVNDVYYQEGLVNIIAKNMKKMSWFALGFSLLFLIVAITLIHNTIRLALYSNRFLIKNMELVGASWGFISRPYIRKSIWHGILSAILAIGALVLVLLLAQREITELRALQDVVSSLILFATLLILGILISGVSTWYVINKYLKMRLDDLY